MYIYSGDGHMTSHRSSPYLRSALMLKGTLWGFTASQYYDYGRASPSSIYASTYGFIGIFHNIREGPLESIYGYNLI